MNEWIRVEGQDYAKEPHWSVPKDKHHHRQRLELENGLVTWTHTHERGDDPHRHGVGVHVTAETVFQDDDDAPTPRDSAK